MYVITQNFNSRAEAITSILNSLPNKKLPSWIQQTGSELVIMYMDVSLWIRKGKKEMVKERIIVYPVHVNDQWYYEIFRKNT